MSTTFTVKVGANLLNNVGSGSASTATQTLSGTFTSSPAITSFVASNGNGLVGTGINDLVTITFDQQTNFAVLYSGGSMSSADISGLIQFGSMGDSFGNGATGAWTTDGTVDTLVITIQSATGLHLTPLVTSIQLIGSLKDIIGTTTNSRSGPVTLTGTFTSAPTISSVVATNIGANIGLGPRDQVIVTFDQSTNGGSAINKLAVSAAELNQLFGLSGSASFGTSFEGVWNSPSNTILTITFGVDTTGATLIPGVTAFSINVAGGLKDVTSSSGVSTGGSVTLGGTFTSVPAIVSFTAVHTGSGVGHDYRGDSVVIVFDQGTDRAGSGSNNLNKAAVDALLELSGSDSFGSAYTGVWSTTNSVYTTLTILIDASATSISLTLGSTTVQVIGDLKDSYSSTAASTSTSGALGGAFTTPPAIVSAVATNTPGDNVGPTSNDQIVITFDQATNGAGSLTKTQVDALIVLGGGSVGSSNFGTDYTGVWTSSSVLTITIGAVTSGIQLVPGTTTVGIKGSAGLTDDLQSTISSTSSIVLIGTFTTTPAILSIVASNSNNQVGLGNGDTVTITFDQSTNRAGASTQSVNKLFIDGLFTLSGSDSL
ncbi:MAG: hypothetical protein JZU60_04760, partial [Ilumatobacteraceae bacterium]|nr:hypothetical protein [Ilumatobacteraceae bacterium]